MALKDNSLVFRESAVALTATTQTSAVNIPQGTANELLHAEIQYDSAANASGSNTIVFTVEHSADGSTNWQTLAGATAAETLTLSTTAQKGKVFIAFSSPLPFYRVVATLAGAGTSPTFKMNAFVTQARQ